MAWKMAAGKLGRSTGVTTTNNKLETVHENCVAAIYLLFYPVSLCGVKPVYCCSRIENETVFTKNVELEQRVDEYSQIVN